MNYAVEFTDTSATMFIDGEAVSRFTLRSFPDQENKSIMIDMLYMTARYNMILQTLAEAHEEKE